MVRLRGPDVTLKLEMSLPNSFFGQKFGLTEHNLESYLSEALSAGGDYADLYFEYIATSSLSIDESIVKSAIQGVSLGVGVRVISGERTGYAYSDDLSPEKINKAARVAACIAQGPSKVEKIGFEEARARNLYPVLTAPNETSLADRVELVKRADRAARSYDPRIFQVQASYVDNLRHVLVANSDGILSMDRQPLARMSVLVLARDPNGSPQRGFSGGGGRVALDFFLHEKTPEHFAREAARQAVVQLDAVPAPAGEMTVVLGPGCGDRRERQGQVGEGQVGPDEVADDGGQPGAGEQVRPVVLQGAGLGQRPAREDPLARQPGPQVRQPVGRAPRCMASTTPLSEPTDVPVTMSGGTSRSLSACSIPTWTAPRLPPPPSTYPTGRGRSAMVPSMYGSSRPAAGVAWTARPARSSLR